MQMTDMHSTIVELQKQLLAAQETARQANAAREMKDTELEQVKMNIQTKIDAAVEKAKNEVCLKMFDTYKQGQNDGLVMIERVRSFVKHD